MYQLFSEILCTDPGIANSSYTVSDDFRIGSVVSYSCNTGFIYTAGYLTRTCQVDGTWDGVFPTCLGLY